MVPGPHTSQVGVTVLPDRAHVAYAHAGSPVLLTSPPAADPTEVLLDVARLLGPAQVPPDVLVVDLSAVLLDAIVRAGPDVAGVAVIRAVPRAATDPLVARSPADRVEQLVRARYTVPGGHDLLGNELHPLDVGVLEQVCAALVADGIRHVAIVSPGSQARPAHERVIADAVQAALPGARVSAASDFGGQGLVVREATVVFDCALGGVVDRELARWEAAVQRAMPGAALRVGRGDGGCTTPAWARALPSVALAATGALALGGAAALAGLADCRVTLRPESGPVVGDVRNGLPVVRSTVIAELGTELVVPTAVLTPDVGADRNREGVSDRPRVVATQGVADLAAAGAAVARPTAWLDEITFIESSAELDRVRRDVSARARAIVTANGAVPGTDYLTELSVVAVPYSPPGTVRIRVRMAGAGRTPELSRSSP